MNQLTNRKDFQFFCKLMAVSFALFIIYTVFVHSPKTNGYVSGEILMPDYVHDDTLIVIDAETMNFVFNAGIIPPPETDAEINQVLSYTTKVYLSDVTGNLSPTDIQHYIAPLEGHFCKWDKCPYKRLQPWQYLDSVLNYTGEPEGSEAVQIDLLHLSTPNATYDDFGVLGVLSKII